MDRISLKRHGSPGLGLRNDGGSRVQKPDPGSDKAAKLAALKARVSAAIGTSKAKGGLNVGLHPALEDLGQWKPGGNKSSDSKSNSRHDSNRPPKKQALDLSGPSNEEIKSNPYFDASLGAPSVKPRQSRHLIFNQKGKYIQQANALRRQAALEALKKKIAAGTRKVGIDEDKDVEKNFIIDAPPEIEWWDEGLVDGKNYDDIENPKALKIESEDTIVTRYIQHPVAIEPPQDKNVPAPKPMYLTSTEQAKLRRQRRMADLKEEQAKIRLGLVPAPPPKVKKGNLMRVLGEEAVKDPTAVEARVNREIADRHAKHVEANEERKLTKEQKHDKLATNQEKDAAKGLHMLVFKINSLANGQHRYKININADQLALTGLVIMHPKQNLVIVEGGEWSIKHYKKLMQNRINWTENLASREKDAQNEALKQWLKAENEEGDLKDLAENQCKLIFEGEVKSRAFRKWGSKVCETDSEAREVLTKSKMENFWNLAKSTH
ncbi:PRP3-domain-containing protein [Annulohypoxylon maeteangense]|uniref:PRP3-domain-containing protein n=1 Tax=Annulohypoxylon maeteangense TaxID=1927788 RepID=UPI00200750EC|nr:PRP3-domain-containing protein [Annulohypoxylon maeteangense]KAI0884800.1 PRP3-domain-containing protein [Annulohypoxylon maeteangense]